MINFFTGLTASGVLGILLFAAALDGANWWLAFAGFGVSAAVAMVGYYASVWVSDEEVE